MSHWPITYGAVADGKLHTLAESFGNLAQARRSFPFAQSLDESIDRCAIQKCLNLASGAAPFHFGETVQLSAGTYYLDKSLTIQGVNGLTLSGEGFGTVLEYHGDPKQDALQVISCQDCLFDSFTVKAPGGTNPSAGVWLTNTNQPTDGIVSSNNHFRRLKVTGPWQNAWMLTPGSGGDNNNDLHTWDDCGADQFTEDGVYIYGGQCHFLRFDRCGFTAASNTGTAGIRSDYGAFMHIDQCVFNGCENNVQLTQFYTGPITITRCNSEGSRRYLAASWNTGHGGPLPISVTNCRGAMAPLPGDYILDFNNEGPLTIVGNTLYTTNAQQPLVAFRFGAATVMHCDNIYQTGAGGPKWDSRGAIRIPPLDATGYSIKSWHDMDNVYQDS